MAAAPPTANKLQQHHGGLNSSGHHTPKANAAPPTAHKLQRHHGGLNSSGHHTPKANAAPPTARKPQRHRGGPKMRSWPLRPSKSALPPVPH